jgi:hypothetical protein
MKKPTLLLFLATTTAGWLAMALPAAESAGAGADDQTIKEELTAREDPTILVRRAWLETQWDHFKDDSDNVELTLGGLWAWGISTNLDWAVRLKVPFEFFFAGDAAGDSDDQGLGDIKLATGTAYRFNESWRAGGGIELRFPTASDSDLGDNTWRIMEFGTVAWDATRWLTLSPSIEYNQSYEEQQDGTPVHFLEMFFPATFLLPRQWSLTAKYEAKVDFEDDNDWTHTANFAVAKQLTNAPIGFSLSIEKPFDSEKAFQINLAATYFFRSK